MDVLNEMHMRTLHAAAREAVSRALVAALSFGGSGDPHGLDVACAGAIRDYLNTLPYTFRCVAGEGLWDGHDEDGHIQYDQVLGQREPSFPTIDFAVDPFDGTTAFAEGFGPGGVCVIGMAPKGTLLHVPDICYAEKLAIGPAAYGVRLSLSGGIEQNIAAVAARLNLPVERIVVSVLDRQKPPKDRHAKLIARIRSTGARVKLLQNGDLMGGIEPCDPCSGVHLQAGSGGGPEMLLTAIGVSAMGGDMVTRFMPKDDAQRATIQTLTGNAADATLHLKDVVRGPSIFAAAAATSGPLMQGPVYLPDGRVAFDVLTVRSDERNISREQHTVPW